MVWLQIQGLNWAKRCEKPFKSLWIQMPASRCVIIKSYCDNMQQIYRRITIPKCNLNKVAVNFIEIALHHRCSSVNLLHIFRTYFPKNSSGGLLQWIERSILLKWEEIDHGKNVNITHLVALEQVIIIKIWNLTKSRLFQFLTVFPPHLWRPVDILAEKQN